MTYYLKYRPQKISELDLVNVRDSLGKVATSKSIPHAFLFAGPKGTGKTSAARILAKVVNCTNRTKTGEPCNKCANCKSISGGANIDIIEIDAASHRGIDDVRVLRDAVKLAPAGALKKVYIIDEAHMLTTEASNALLKTLEEPPSHVIFVLATTNPEKLLPTIKSRVTVIPFVKASDAELVQALKRVVRGENLKPGSGVLELVASASDGSFRDAVKLLEQLVTAKAIVSVTKAQGLIQTVRFSDVDTFLKLLVEANPAKLVQEIEAVSTKGIEMDYFVEGVLGRLRLALHATLGLGMQGIDALNQEDILTLISLFMGAASQLPTSPIDTLPVEVASIKWCEDRTPSTDGGSAETEITKSSSEKTGGAELFETKQTGKVRELTTESWTQILASIRVINSSTEALLRAARPMGIVGKTLKLSVFYRFHKERLEELQHMRLLEDAVSEIIGGGRITVECELAEQPTPLPKQQVNGAGLKMEPQIVDADAAGTAVDALTEVADESIIDIAKDIFGN